MDTSRNAFVLATVMALSSAACSHPVAEARSTASPAAQVTAPRPVEATGTPQADLSTADGLVHLDPEVLDNKIAQAVVTVLTTYFNGVNEGRYDQAYRAYSKQMKARHPFAKWQSEMSSSQSSGVVVTSVKAPGGLDATVSADVTFTSRQTADQGPDGSTCTEWSLTYRLVPSASRTALLIDSASGDWNPCDESDPNEPLIDDPRPTADTTQPDTDATSEAPVDQDQVPVPVLVGMMMDTADAVARSVGLRLSVLPSGFDYGNNLSNFMQHDCVIIRQNLRPGTLVSPGSTISATGQCSAPQQ